MIKLRPCESAHPVKQLSHSFVSLLIVKHPLSYRYLHLSEPNLWELLRPRSNC
jgi:hypothetical protein